MTMLITVLLIALGGLWKFIDGMDKETSGLNTGVRNTLLVALVLACTYKPWTTSSMALMEDWRYAWFAAFVVVSMILGQTKWENFAWQAIRFGGLAAIAVLPFGWNGSLYVLLCSIGGISYPALKYLDGRNWLPRWKEFSGFEAYARWVLGATVIGGINFL